MKDKSQITKARRERERDAHREAILDAAESIFVEKGYEPTTIDEIARKAEFATGTLYNFFKGKEELFDAIAERIFITMIETFNSEICVEPDPRRAVEKLISFRIKDLRQHGAFLHIFHPIQHAKYRAGAKVYERNDVHHKMFMDHLDKERSLILRAMDAGVIPRLPVDDVMAIIEGSVRAFTMIHPGDKTPPSVQACLERARNTLLPLLFGENVKKATEK